MKDMFNKNIIKNDDSFSNVDSKCDKILGWEDEFEINNEIEFENKNIRNKKQKVDYKINWNREW